MGVVNRGYAALARPVLFRLGSGDAEVAHHTALQALAFAGRHRVALRGLERLLLADLSPRRLFGITFPNAVGLAAGMDKDGVALRAWPALGFGFTEVGTVTAHAQPGNEKPRLFRLPASAAIINRMGFNNAGAEALARVLRQTGPLPTPLGISLGKSKITPVDDAVQDYLVSLRALHSYADYVAVNVSSPNTAGLRSLQDRAPLTELLDSLITEAHSLALAAGSREVPVLVKIAPDLTDAAIAELLEVCEQVGVAGVIATNTTLARDSVAASDLPLVQQAGGLSGAPLAVRAREVVRFIVAHTGLPVIGVGGIASAADGMAMLDAGASLLQLYTGFVYAGPGLVRDLARAVAVRDREGA